MGLEDDDILVDLEEISEDDDLNSSSDRLPDDVIEILDELDAALLESMTPDEWWEELVNGNDALVKLSMTWSPGWV